MKSSFYTFSMRYGLYIGLLSALNFIMNNANSTIIKALSWLVWATIIILLYYFTTVYRKKECEDQLTYGEAFKFIFMTYLFGALVSTAVRIIYLKWINPDLMPSLYDLTMQTLDGFSSLYSATEMQTIQDTLSVLLQPVKYSFLLFWADVFSGVFWALILAIFTKKTSENSVSNNSEEEDEII